MRTRLFTVIGLVAYSPLAVAMMPPPPTPLKSRVQAATHVFIGAVERIDATNDDGKEFPDAGGGIVFMATVKVEEVIKPKLWVPKDGVKVWFGSGMFNTENLRKEFVGKRFIFLTAEKKSWFEALPSGWDFFVPLEKKKEVEELLQPKGKASDK